MNKSHLLAELNTIKNAKRTYRDKSAKFVLDHPVSFPFLLEIVFEDKTRIAIKAAWILELVCQQNISLIKNHLNYFIDHINNITDESALRPLSKVCSFISKSSQNREIELTKIQKENIIETNFDWIITNHKIATQVFAMDTLFILGKEYDWVHTELKLVLEKNTSSGTAGYQSHAKKILKLLK